MVDSTARKTLRELKKRGQQLIPTLQLAQKCIRADRYSSGDIASPLPNWRRWHEERRVGGSYARCLPKAFCPMYRRTRSCWKSVLVAVLGRELCLRAYQRVWCTS